MTLKLEFKIENNRLTIKGLPPHLQVRGMGYTSAVLAELKYTSIASANIMLSKMYMDSVRKVNAQTDPHMLDAALLAAIIKYGSVFKADSKGRVIDPSKIFQPKVLIINKSISENPMVIEDPDLENLKRHQRIIKLRDQFIAHDDRIVGHTECFAAFDDRFTCEHVIALTQRSPVYSAIKDLLGALPMCIDIVFTWLQLEKDRQCQLVNDEINKLKLRVRKKFPDAVFDNHFGLPDAAERKLRDEPYWMYDWNTGEKRQVGGASEPQQTQRETTGGRSGWPRKLLGGPSVWLQSISMLFGGWKKL
jgi:hypothetical protein